MSIVGTVEFHHGVASKLAYAQRLVRKAYRNGVRVVVTGELAELRQLDQQLWTADELYYSPLGLDAGTGLPDGVPATPIWLTPHPDRVPEGHEVLVNLGQEVPPGLARYKRLFDIVSQVPDDRQAGRTRWKAYQAMGWEVRPHEVTTS